MNFDLDSLAKYKQGGAFLPGSPADARSFYAPEDDVHALLVYLLGLAKHSIVLNMFGYDDEQLDAIIRKKASSPKFFLQMSLDSTQAHGKHEAEILTLWKHDVAGKSIAVGQSAKHAISHLKLCIIDGWLSLAGSTNWSLSGEEKQDNELTVCICPIVAAERRKILDINHDCMLKQMHAKALKAAKGNSPRRHKGRKD